MRQLPRFAVGTLQPQARREPLLWGLLSALHELEASPLLFRSSCCWGPCDAAKSILGRPARHLDSWAMTRQAAIQAISRAAGTSDLAVVAGAYDVARPAPSSAEAPPGSSLDTLCEWLDLPSLAVVDVSTLSACNLPKIPPRLDGLLLDRVADHRAAAYWRTTLESLWKAPVLGWLDEAESLRTLCNTLPAGRGPSVDLCRALAARLVTTVEFERLFALADRAPPLAVEPDDLFLQAASRRRFRIATAYDESYCGYYPETLDLLEAAGAELCDFSPLRSGAIPDGVDIVYFGCGHPERCPEELAKNHCLKQSLRCFAAAGGRIYAEGSGLAYLCREIAFPCGRTVPMTGLLPATARWLPHAPEPEPTEVVFGASSWLVPARTALRGYRHAGWQIEPRGSMITYAQDSRQRLDVLGRNNVIGSRVLINLAANRHLLQRFFEPYAPVATRARDL
jgi:cobyrinic acid a,c-diamide synthase